MDRIQVRTCRSVAQVAPAPLSVREKSLPQPSGLSHSAQPLQLTSCILPFGPVAPARLFLEHVSGRGLVHLPFPNPGILSPMAPCLPFFRFHSNASISKGPFLTTVNELRHLLLASFLSFTCLYFPHTLTTYWFVTVLTASQVKSGTGPVNGGQGETEKEVISRLCLGNSLWEWEMQGQGGG